MDRLVGYKASPFLWKTVYRGLSAGRVQSVALRLICERDAEIAAFTPEEYWSIAAEMMTNHKEIFRCNLIKIDGKTPVLPDETSVMKHLEKIRRNDYSISDHSSKTVSRKPYPPYTTSTLQQDASRRLGFSTKRTMALAQELYEGVDLPEGRVGLITYMRTDSTRLAKSALQEARESIATLYGLEYVPPQPRIFRSKKTAQDAHEAIRPTSARRTPKQVASHLSPGQLKLYSLIWNRFMASQMADAKILQTTLDVSGGKYLFRATGSVITFRGFLQIYEIEKEESDQTNIPEKVNKDDPVTLSSLDPQQHFTKPPAHYNEASLVKEMDTLGIGRPSTYSLIISTLIQRNYVERSSRNLLATNLGQAVTHILTRQFPEIFNVDFTAVMEKELDQIVSGEKNRRQVLDDFYEPFSAALERAMEKKDEIKESLQENINEPCPRCGGQLLKKWGRNGQFIACSNYPDCNYTKPIEPEEETKEVCDLCGSPMIIKTGRFGRFLACSSYPECKNTKPLSTGIGCPEEGCSGTIVERKSRRGKIFYGCSRYPDCKFASWSKPVPKQCPVCGNSYMEEKRTKAQGLQYRCPHCKESIVVEKTME